MLGDKFSRYFLRHIVLMIYVCSSATTMAQTENIPPEEQTTEEQIIDSPIIMEQAREREKLAQEDPMAVRQAKRVDREDQWIDEPDGIDFYGSARIRYRDTEIENIWSDGNSRIGANAHWQYAPSQWLFGRLELGINVLDELDRLFKPSGNSRRGTDDELFVRLAYLGLETRNAIYVAGKNWSTYYQVAGFTDRFDSTGGEASGTYNASTDGGSFGTGRADGVLQSRFLLNFPEKVRLKPVHLNIQLQYDQPIPQVTNARYGIGFGLSTVYETRDDFSVGLAYNYANVQNKDSAEIINAGIDGNAHAGLIGLRWFGRRWFAATTVARLQNVETTDEGIYFDGWGWELYSHYNLHRQWWLVGGWNYLRPDSGESQAGQYQLRYAVAGVRYSLEGFQRMLYFDARLDDGRLSDGISGGNVYTIGIQWDV